MTGFSTRRMPKSLKRYEHLVADWEIVTGEEFKYDVFLKKGYAWGFWYGDNECQRTEHFNTVAEAREALSRVVKVDPVKNCAKCRHWTGSMCHA